MLPKMTAAALPITSDLKTLESDLNHILSCAEDLLRGDPGGGWSDGVDGQKEVLRSLASRLDDMVSTADRTRETVLDAARGVAARELGDRIRYGFTTQEG